MRFEEKKVILRILQRIYVYNMDLNHHDWKNLLKNGMTQKPFSKRFETITSALGK